MGYGSRAVVSELNEHPTSSKAPQPLNQRTSSHASSLAETRPVREVLVVSSDESTFEGLAIHGNVDSSQMAQNIVELTSVATFYH
jgi:hypothetical protein